MRFFQQFKFKEPLWRRIERARLDYVIIFVAVFAVAVYWQFSPTIGDPDGFYHAKMALFLKEGVLLREMPWMQFASIRDSFTDHHLLYHAVLVPFVSLGNPLIGVKLATAVFTGLFFSMFYWTLRRLHIRGALFYTALLLCTSAFTFRLSLVKANSLGLVVLLAILVALFEKRWLALIGLNILYVWLYAGWPFAWVVVVMYGVAQLVAEMIVRHGPMWRFGRERRARIRSFGLALVCTVAGSIIGLVANPYWPGNLDFYWQQVWQIAIVNLGTAVNVGGEWRPVSLDEVFGFFWFALPLCAIATANIFYQAKRVRVRTWLLFGLTVVSLLFTIKSRRYVELSAPLMVLFSGAAFTDVFPSELARRFRDTWKKEARWLRQLLASFAIGLVLILVLPRVGFWSQIAQVRGELVRGVPIERYRTASAWLASSTPRWSLVLHSDWDDWPMLFYYNTHNRYLIGLDPTFMYNYDAELYYQWESLTARGETDNLRTFVATTLGAQYVMIEKDHTAMQETVSSNVYAEPVYEDDEVWIYQFSR